MSKIPALLVLQAIILLLFPAFATYVVSARDLDLERHWKGSISYFYDHAAVVVDSPQHNTENKAELMRVVESVFDHQKAKTTAMDYIGLVAIVMSLVLLIEAAFIARKLKKKGA